MRSGFIPLHYTHKVLEIKSLIMYFVYALTLTFSFAKNFTTK